MSYTVVHTNTVAYHETGNTGTEGTDADEETYLAIPLYCTGINVKASVCTNPGGSVYPAETGTSNVPTSDAGLVTGPRDALKPPACIGGRRDLFALEPDLDRWADLITCHGWVPGAGDVRELRLYKMVLDLEFPTWKTARGRRDSRDGGG